MPARVPGGRGRDRTRSARLYEERNDWFNGGSSGSKLVPMCGICNSGNGGKNPEPNDFEVGKKFRGRGEGKA